MRIKLISKKKIFWTFHLICKMELMVLTKSQAIGFFILIVYETPHQTSKSKFQIPSKTDCRKTCLMRRNSIQQVVNRTMLQRKVRLRLILNTTKINGKNQNIELEILFGLTHHSTQLYLQMLQKLFFDWSADIFQSVIDYISIEGQWRLVTAVCKMCLK